MNDLKAKLEKYIFNLFLKISINVEPLRKTTNTYWLVQLYNFFSAKLHMMQVFMDSD